MAQEELEGIVCGDRFTFDIFFLTIVASSYPLGMEQLVDGANGKYKAPKVAEMHFDEKTGNCRASLHLLS